MRLTVSGQRVHAAIAAWLSLAFTFSASQLQAGGCSCPACVGQAVGQGPVGCVSGYQLLERTIQVPTMVTERRIVNVTECRIETRERTVTVQKMIPEIKQVRDMCVVMVPHVETRVERYQICVPAWREVVQDVTVQVPTQELRTATRTVCRQVQEMCVVTRDRGHWDEVAVDALQYAGCGAGTGCGFDRRWLRAGGGCGICRACRGSFAGVDRYDVGYDAGCVPGVTQQIQRVWKPDIVTEQIPVIVWRNQVVEEPYEYHVTNYHPEVRRQTVRLYEPVRQEQEREVQVTVCVPTKRELVRNISTYRTVCEPQVQRYNVRVPYTVQKEVDVQVCRLMPKTVVCRVPVTAPSVCRDCAGRGCRHCGR